MSNRRTTLAIGVLLAAVALATSPPRDAAAQVRPVKTDTVKKARIDTSAKRIRIKKDTVTRTAGGEVCLPIACVSEEPGSVSLKMALDREAYARDAQRVLDSIATESRVRMEVAAVENRVARERQLAMYDSIVRASNEREAAQLAMKRHLARGFYIGLAGGTTLPQRDIRNGYTDGWNTTIPVGWDANDSPFGVRADLAYDRLHGTQLRDQGNAILAASGDVSIWSLDLDGKVRVHAPGTPSRTHLYALGGIGAHRVTNGVYGTTGSMAGKSLDFGSAQTKLGWNLGAGVSMQWGPTELFVESRFTNIKTDMAYHAANGVGTYTSYMPIVVGLQWF